MPTTGSPKAIQVDICDDACKRSPAIFHKSRTLCPGIRLVSDTINILHVLNRDIDMIKKTTLLPCSVVTIMSSKYFWLTKAHIHLIFFTYVWRWTHCHDRKQRNTKFNYFALVLHCNNTVGSCCCWTALFTAHCLREVANMPLQFAQLIACESLGSHHIVFQVPIKCFTFYSQYILVDQMLFWLRFQI